MRHSIRDHSLRAVAVIAVLFGLLTIASGGRVLFGSDAVRQSAGATVGFVLWFNFVADRTWGHCMKGDVRKLLTSVRGRSRTPSRFIVPMSPRPHN
jgi:hypothetical protein